MNAEITPPMLLARVREVGDDGHRLWLEFANGNFGNATGNFDFPTEIGTVVLVGADPPSIVAAPGELWPEDKWVGVVRLKLDDITVVDGGARWRRVPTNPAVEYREGNTVEARDSVGVIRVLAQQPLKLFELPAVDDDLIEVTFLTNNAGSETFEDFGGLHQVVERARELIELPLQERERFAAIGARPVKGVLFTGAPGTGKTMLARIIANTTRAKFYKISGPEILSKWYGQSEEILRTLFQHAGKQERAIIFFDEIDSVAGHRDSDAHEASRRVVAQLLTLMDGFKPDANVVVIAATNRPQDIDSALLRPGRFDSELAFPLPARDDRQELLLLSQKRHSTCGHLPCSLVAERTEGWSAAELAAIWTEAALLAVSDEREVIVTEDFIGGYQRVVAQRSRSAPSGDPR